MLEERDRRQNQNTLVQGKDLVAAASVLVGSVTGRPPVSQGGCSANTKVRDPLQCTFCGEGHFHGLCAVEMKPSESRTLVRAKGACDKCGKCGGCHVDNICVAKDAVSRQSHRVLSIMRVRLLIIGNGILKRSNVPTSFGTVLRRGTRIRFF